MTVASGASQTFTIDPITCCNVADVKVDGGSVGAVPSYTFYGGHLQPYDRRELRGRPNGTGCTDNDSCTQLDACNNGACAGTPVVPAEVDGGVRLARNGAGADITWNAAACATSLGCGARAGQRIARGSRRRRRDLSRGRSSLDHVDVARHGRPAAGRRLLVSRAWRQLGGTRATRLPGGERNADNSPRDYDLPVGVGGAEDTAAFAAFRFGAAFAAAFFLIVLTTVAFFSRTGSNTSAGSGGSRSVTDCGKPCIGSASVASSGSTVETRCRRSSGRRC